MYEKQTHSANKRQMHQAFDKMLGTEKHYEQLNSKHFKTNYAGKPTKRYKRIWGKIQAAGQISENDILKFLKSQKPMHQPDKKIGKVRLPFRTPKKQGVD